MKSKRAKEYVEKSHRYSNIATIFRRYEDAILIAEQDAEERAVKAFCGRCGYYIDRSMCERDFCPDLEGFKQLLNNGGQSDE